MSRLSRVTMGAAASKKLRAPPHRARIFSARGSLVRGPVATMAGPAGSSVTSSRRRVMRGSSSMAWVTRRENWSRSTARAPPAGTAHCSAQGTSREPRRRISSFKRPAALSTRLALRELEQMSSARPWLLWAGENFWGFISYNVTGMPRLASCQAASHPARPAPNTVTGSIFLSPFSLVLCYSPPPSGSLPSKVQPGVTQYNRLSFVFFCIKVLPQTGHFSLLGGSQETKSHLGYSLQP